MLAYFRSFRLRPALAVLAVSGAALGLGLAIPVLATTQAGPLLVTVSSTPNPYAIEGETTVNGSVGVVGYGNSTSAASQIGVKGEVKGTSGIGVEGVSVSTGFAASTGVYGSSASGNGVYGQSTSSMYSSIYGFNAQNGGTAVQGEAVGYGVFGQSSESNGIQGVTTANTSGGAPYAGVTGVDSSSGQTEAGVYGVSPKGAGVYGFSNSGAAVSANSTSGVGVSATTGGQNAIEASTSDPNVQDYAAAILGKDITNTQTATGVEGTSTNGTGVIGNATTTGTGVFGEVSGSGIGVAASSFATGGTSLQIYSNGGKPITATDGRTEIMELDNGGNLTLTGGLTQHGTPNAVLRGSDGLNRTVYGAEQTQATLEDFGEGQMTGGRAYVRLDPAFTRVLDRNSSYIVFLTPEGPTMAPLYVSEKSLSGFTVREMTNHANIAFGYRILARPSGASGARLALYKAPPSAPLPAALLDRIHAAHPIAFTKGFTKPGRLGTAPRLVPPPVTGVTLRR
jgi:hypothetical protein